MNHLLIEISTILMENGADVNIKNWRGNTLLHITHSSVLVKIALKYDSNGNPVSKSIKRISTPGKRKYVSVDELPRVINGLGIAIISTSKGLITNKQAKEAKLGGEVVCGIY